MVALRRGMKTAQLHSVGRRLSQALVTLVAPVARPAMPSSARPLIAISLLNAVSAIGGGIALVTGVLPVPTSLLRHTPFDTYVVPGLFLAVVIGGSSLAGAIALISHASRARYISAAAGVTMVGWILGETVIVRGFSWLQGVYLVTGVLVAVRSWHLPVVALESPSGATPAAGPQPVPAGSAELVQ